MPLWKPGEGAANRDKSEYLPVNYSFAACGEQVMSHIYRHPVYSESDPVLIIESPYSRPYQGFYSLGIDPNTSEIYAGDANDYVQRGMVYRYNPEGMVIDSFIAGIVPSSFCIK